MVVDRQTGVAGNCWISIPHHLLTRLTLLLGLYPSSVGFNSGLLGRDTLVTMAVVRLLEFNYILGYCGTIIWPLVILGLTLGLTQLLRLHPLVII